jgi:hypothetical protein
MTTQSPKQKLIRPLEGFGGMTDAELVARATAVQSGLSGNSNFPTLPVDLAAFKTDIDSLSALISEALDGSKKVIARKNNQRQVVIRSLRLLARFVEVLSSGDAAIFKSSGFEPVSTTRVPPAPLPFPVIRSVDHGATSGEIVVQVESIPKAKNYEFRYAAVINGAPPTSWSNKVVGKVKPPVGFSGLTPGTVYAFQVRAFGAAGYTDWTDSTTCMCV